MDPVSAGLAGAQLLLSLTGMLGASSAAKKAAARRQQLLMSMAQQNDAALQALRDRNRRSLYEASGQGGDALRALGANLGSAMGAGGVWNSSATAGALAHGNDTLMAQLAGMANTQAANEAEQAYANQRWLGSQQLGVASEDVANARAQQGSTAEGLGALLQALPAFLPTKKAAPVAPAAGQVPTRAASPALTLSNSAMTMRPLQPVSLQSGLQTMTQGNLFSLGVPNARRMGPAMNGNQGYTLPGLYAGYGAQPFSLTRQPKSRQLQTAR